MGRTQDAEIVGMQPDKQLVRDVVFLGRQNRDVGFLVTATKAARQNVMTLSVPIDDAPPRSVDQPSINSPVIHYFTRVGFPFFVVQT